MDTNHIQNSSFQNTEMSRQILNVAETFFTIKLDTFWVHVARNFSTGGRPRDKQRTLFKNLRLRHLRISLTDHPRIVDLC